MRRTGVGLQPTDAHLGSETALVFWNRDALRFLLKASDVRLRRRRQPPVAFVGLALDLCPLQREIAAIEPPSNQQLAVVEDLRLNAPFAFGTVHPQLA